MKEECLDKVFASGILTESTMLLVIKECSSLRKRIENIAFFMIEKNKQNIYELIQAI